MLTWHAIRHNRGHQELRKMKNKGDVGLFFTKLQRTDSCHHMKVCTNFGGYRRSLAEGCIIPSRMQKSTTARPTTGVKYLPKARRRSRQM